MSHRSSQPSCSLSLFVSLAASRVVNVLSNGLWGLTDRPRSPRAMAAQMLRELRESIKATGWISAETPHYLLGGTPISSNWFDKCSGIHRMRDEGQRRRELHRVTGGRKLQTPKEACYTGWTGFDYFWLNKFRTFPRMFTESIKSAANDGTAYWRLSFYEDYEHLMTSCIINLEKITFFPFLAVFCLYFVIVYF